MTTMNDDVEAVARAIYDAEDTQSGDTIGTVIWNSEHLFYDTVEGEEIVDTARRASMPTCRDAARAAIEAITRTDEVVRLREALDWAEDFDPQLVEQIRERAILASIKDRQ
jgi:hypothetical protein